MQLRRPRQERAAYYIWPFVDCTLDSFPCTAVVKDTISECNGRCAKFLVETPIQWTGAGRRQAQALTPESRFGHLRRSIIFSNYPTFLTKVWGTPIREIQALVCILSVVTYTFNMLVYIPVSKIGSWLGRGVVGEGVLTRIYLAAVMYHFRISEFQMVR